MNYLSVEGLSKSFGDKILFSDISFGIEKGEKAALVAANGTGKSTLMKILTGCEQADTGSVTFCNDIKIGYLEQLPDFSQYETIDDLLESGHTEVMRVIRKYESIINQQNNAGLSAELERVSAEMDALDAWSYELRLNQLLTRFEIGDTKQRISSLSGGQIKRLALAFVLLDNPDFLILDEPTNHLDIEMIEWLERYLSQSNITLLIVTHDRYFLDRVCNKIIELYRGVIYIHNGNYDYFVRKSREREENKLVAAEKAGRLLKHELEWMRSTPQARTSKSKSRIDAFYDLKERARIRHDDNRLEFGMNTRRLGGKILELSDVSKSFGEMKILDGFDYVFKRGERIGLIGKNGVGKTTFLNLVTGSEKPDKGEVTVGETVVYGYYTQKGITFDDKKTVLEAVTDIADYVEFGKNTYTAEQMLAHFMFPYSIHHQKIALLSGGEKRRLYLLTVIMSSPNFLILDEPTNDLDILTLQKLEDFLKDYKGCLLVVSHDRFFMDEVVDQLFVFQGEGKVKGFAGNYSQYNEWKQAKAKDERKEEAAVKKEKNVAKQVSERPKRRTYKEQQEYEALMVEMENLEKEKKELLETLPNTTDYQEIERKGMRLREIDELLDQKELRWLELDELGN